MHDCSATNTLTDNENTSREDAAGGLSSSAYDAHCSAQQLIPPPCTTELTDLTLHKVGVSITLLQLPRVGQPGLCRGDLLPRISVDSCACCLVQLH